MLVQSDVTLQQGKKRGAGELSRDRMKENVHAFKTTKNLQF